ncbi:hypothetical protein OG900_33245 [Streptomyces sp. NBC_00433]
MLPAGTHVTVRSVGHLPNPGKHQKLIGRQGVVGDHENSLNIVTALGSTIGGYYAFPDNALTATGHGTPPAMPRRYRVRGYHAED